MESMFSSNRPGWAALLDEKVTAYLPDLKYVHDEPLARHTSFRIGGPATRMAFPTSGEQIVLLTGFAQECGVTPFLLGNGTNLLVADEGLDTLVIQTGEGLNRIALDGGIITADAGVSLARLGVFAWQHSLTGLEFAHGIPGSLGGGVVMNAGAYGGELKDVLTEVTALFPDGVRTLRGEELALGYSLPHSATAQYKNCGYAVAKSDLQPGDLVFFSDSSHAIGHVGIYIGNGQIIHARYSVGKITIDSLSASYYASRYVGAKRIA